MECACGNGAILDAPRDFYINNKNSFEIFYFFFPLKLVQTGSRSWFEDIFESPARAGFVLDRVDKKNNIFDDLARGLPRSSRNRDETIRFRSNKNVSKLHDSWPSHTIA